MPDGDVSIESRDVVVCFGRRLNMEIYRLGGRLVVVPHVNIAAHLPIIRAHKTHPILSGYTTTKANTHVMTVKHGIHLAHTHTHKYQHALLSRCLLLNARIYENASKYLIMRYYWCFITRRDNIDNIVIIIIFLYIRPRASGKRT